MLDGVQSRLLLQATGLMLMGVFGSWIATLLVFLAQYGFMFADAGVSMAQISQVTSASRWVVSISQVVAMFVAFIVGMRMFFASGWLFGVLVRSLAT